ncbi:MAG TPA: NADH-quinone oxidoreductase subunit NuoK, partial [Pirellulales bacterium]
MDEAKLMNFLVVGAMLFTLGMVGFLSRRNMIIMFLSVEMMLQAVAINLVAFSWYHNNWNGQIFTIFVITVAACEAAISLGLVMMLYHRSGSLDVTVWQNARESGVGAYVDEEIPFVDAEPIEFPHL